MAPELCPYCGRQEHPAGERCTSPERQKPEPNSGFTPPVDGVSRSASHSYGGFEGPLGTKLSAGTKVGEFQILDRIGEGGMGTVYSAVHPIIGKKVAIKVLSGRLAKNKNATRRFILEARAVNEIQHPGLVDIFSFGRLTDGRHYYVMEFLDGRNLGDILCERIRLPAREVVPIFIEVARVLVAVHAKGIVHRDLKPENILLVQGPKPGLKKVKLVDFGLAKLLEGVPAHKDQVKSGPRTAAGVNVGTPHYMSPEQCRGSPVDARSDLYAVGVLLYESLTGKLPFDGRSPVDIWQAHVEKAPRPPMEVVPALVSPSLNTLIMKLLAKSPDERFQSASELCVALEQLAADAGLRMTPFPPSRETPFPASVQHVAESMRSLSRALSGRPSKNDLVPLDAPGRVAPPTAPALASAQAALLAQAAPKAGVQAVARAGKKPSDYDELAITTEDLPIVYLPDEAFTDEERRQEVEDLRSNLGLQVDEPASRSQEKEQMSALVVNLDSRPAQVDKRHSMPLPASSANMLRLSRPIEERTYVPPLAAPGALTGSTSRTPPEGAAARSHSRPLLAVIRIVLVLSLLASASVMAMRLIK